MKINTPSQKQPVAIYGAGSWGTALALHLARNNIPIILWTNESEHASEMQKDCCNNLFLPGYKFPTNIQPTNNLKLGLKSPKYILIVVPSIGFKNILTQLKPNLPPEIGIVWATKGLDNSGKLLLEVAEEIIGKERPMAILSGPSFANEVAQGLPTAVIVASKNNKFSEMIRQDFNNENFTTYTSSDLIGVSIGGVCKNVLAIATGITDGMQFGANARCALITIGLAEMQTLGIALGAEEKTFSGLACVGDLVLTCTDNQSRNRRLGLAIGQGKSITAAQKEINQIVEGKENAEQLVNLASKFNIKLPITNAVWDIIQGKISAKTAINKIFST